ncbi:MAG: hypothetical protein UY07_C0009G0011 [Parcubacteria group bacterium GW2011_GWA1_47_8]|nr:MAG: hypothetical protein UY07_C0009G0011 [Parcubacteria group bacterium GW2011_GWA1_47_8]
MTNEVSLSSEDAGIVKKPIAKVIDDPANCRWTNTDILKWKGPYMPAVLDPWGKEYYVDNDYHLRANCPLGTETYVPPIMVLASGGPNKENGASYFARGHYDCDDIYLEIR